MKNKVISDCTEAEFLAFVRKICDVDYKTEQEHTRAVLEFDRLSEHPYGNGLIYYPQEGQEDSPDLNRPSGTVVRINKVRHWDWYQVNPKVSPSPLWQPRALFAPPLEHDNFLIELMRW